MGLLQLNVLDAHSKHCLVSSHIVLEKSNEAYGSKKKTEDQKYELKIIFQYGKLKYIRHFLDKAAYILLNRTDK